MNPQKIICRHYFSYSQFSAFKFSPSKFIRQYYYGEQDNDSCYLKMGKKLGIALQFRSKKADKIINKIRQQIPEAKVYEKELKATFKGIPLIGYLDGFDPENCEILEFKSGKMPSEASWKSQMMFYSTLLYLIEKKLPSKITLYYCKTYFDKKGKLKLDGTVKQYDIKISLSDIIMFGKEIIDTYAKIQELIEREYEMYNVLPVWMQNNLTNKIKRGSAV